MKLTRKTSLIWNAVLVIAGAISITACTTPGNNSPYGYSNSYQSSYGGGYGGKGTYNPQPQPQPYYGNGYQGGGYQPPPPQGGGYPPQGGGYPPQQQGYGYGR